MPLLPNESMANRNHNHNQLFLQPETRNPIRLVNILEATIGGTRRHLMDLVLNLDKKHFSVGVLCSTLRDPDFLGDVERMRRAGVSVTLVRMQREVSPVQDLRALVQLTLILLRQRPHIVHAHSSKAGLLGRLSARLACIPAVVYTPHAFPFLMEVSPKRRILYLTLERLAARWSEVIIAVSESERQAALNAQVCEAEKLVVIENGIDWREFQFDENHRRQVRQQLGIPASAPVIGCVGEFRQQKGQRFLIQAASTVLKSFPNAVFVLVGGGELFSDGVELTANLGISESVLFTGKREDARQVYAAFDVYALPSLWEGLPYTPLEAMAAGLPVVATDIGGNRDIVVHGETGLLVPPKDAKALAEGILTLLGDDERRRRMGLRGRELVAERFSLERMVRKVEELYERLYTERVRILHPHSVSR